MLDNHPRPGLVAAAAVLLTLAGALLWLEMFAGAARLASGLVGVGGHLERAQLDLAAGRLKQARFEVLAAQAAARRARSGLDSDSPVLDLGTVRADARAALAEAGHLVRAAEHSAAAAGGSLDVAQDALRGRDPVIVRGSGGARVSIDRIEALHRTLADVRDHLRAARGELRAVDTSELPRRVRRAVADGIATAEHSDRALADAEAGFDILPDILGADEPRWYLVGMQNTAELRGPGGALLRFALLEIENGEPRLQKSETVYDVDVDREPISIPLPEDAWYVRNIEDAQRFGNANWSPDWPSAARLTLAYGRASKGAGTDPLPPIAGMIAVDPFVMKNVMPGVGRYHTRGGRPITGRNVVPFLLHKAYGVHPLRGVRRAVLIDVVTRFYTALLNPAHPTELLQGMGASLAGKHMQIWLADRDEQRYVERMGWDGSIARARRSDYVYVVEQNVGGNKLNYVEQQRHTIDVRIDGNDAVVSTEVEVSNPVVLPQPGYWLGDSEGAHRPMINVYVPRRAQFLDARVRGELLATPEPAIWRNGRPPEHFERGKKVWSATLEILPRGKGRVRFDYRVPGVVRAANGRKHYRLVVQHQPKVHPEDLTVRLELPRIARSVRGRGWSRTGNVLVWSRKVKEDTVLEVSWR